MTQKARLVICGNFVPAELAFHQTSTANVEAAKYLLRNRIPAPYRAHEPPPAEKLESLEQFLRGLGISVPWRGRPSPRDFETVVQQIKGREDRPLIMAVTFGASASFLTPIGYKTNAMVHGPGGYRTRDYLVMGAPLKIVFWILTVTILPRIWPLG